MRFALAGFAGPNPLGLPLDEPGGEHRHEPEEDHAAAPLETMPRPSFRPRRGPHSVHEFGHRAYPPSDVRAYCPASPRLTAEQLPLSVEISPQRMPEPARRFRNLVHWR